MQVIVEIDVGLKKMLGGLVYVIIGIVKFGCIELINVCLFGLDFVWEGDFIVLGIGNGCQVGGGQQLCLQVLIDDGLLDVIVLLELEGEVIVIFGQMLKFGIQVVLEQLVMWVWLLWLQIDVFKVLILNLDGELVQVYWFCIECVLGWVWMYLLVGCLLLVGQGQG